MITVEDKEEIRRLFYLEHKGIHWIARRLGHSRKTVRKALADDAAGHNRQSHISACQQRREPMRNRPRPRGQAAG